MSLLQPDREHLCWVNPLRKELEVSTGGHIETFPILETISTEKVVIGDSASHQTLLVKRCGDNRYVKVVDEVSS